MVNHCCARNCTNAGDVYPGLIFHRFPLKNPEILQKWVMVAKRKDFKPTPNSRICSSHFLPSDYDPPVICGRPHLKKNAVPSIFEFPEHSILKPGEKQVVKQVVKRVLSPSFSENIEESPEANQPQEEVVKKSCTVGTQTNLTGPALVKRLADSRRAKKLLLQRLSRQSKQIDKLREMCILLKENGAVTPKM